MGSSMPRSSGDVKKYDSLRDLECPVCLEIFISPVYMCQNGHQVCERCQPTLTECPVCRAKGRPLIRNRGDEALREQVMVPCINAEEGCQGIFIAKTMLEHLPNCESELLYDCKIFNNDCTKCNYSLKKKDLKKHVVTVHGQNFFLEGENPPGVKFNIHNGNERINETRLVKAFRKLFWFVLDYNNIECKLVAYSYFVGKKDMAKKYKVSIVLSSPNADQRLTYTAVTRHVRESILYMDDRCTTFQISRDFLSLFKNNAGDINVQMEFMQV